MTRKTGEPIAVNLEGEPDDPSVGAELPDGTGDTAPRNPFAALKVDKADRTVFGGSATAVDPQVIDFVESLKKAFDTEPEFWYPVKMETRADLERALDQARLYARTRSAGRLTISKRTDRDNPLLWWFRTAPHVPRSR